MYTYIYMFIMTFILLTNSFIISQLWRFNKREDDFPSLREYNDYLEEVEDMSKYLKFVYFWEFCQLYFIIPIVRVQYWQKCFC